MKLTGIRTLQGTITLRSGLHIGAGDLEMHIGGTDKPVIKHPHTLEPYIPGSSLKGKVRSLLEMVSGLMPVTEGKPVSVKTLKQVAQNDSARAWAEAILKIFGHSGADSDEAVVATLGPTRVSFADCPLDQAWLAEARNNLWPLTEEKSENSIDRIKGTADNPRVTERVPAGARFSFQLTFRCLQEGDDTLFHRLLQGLKLLEGDALGGSGSRGYGRIQFTALSQDGVDILPTFRENIKAL